MSPGLQVASSAATIGSFVINGIGLGHILKDSPKHPAAIIKDARGELSSALAILNQFEEVIQDDQLAPLVGRYDILHEALQELEASVRMPKKGFMQAVTSYRSDRRMAIQTSSMIHNLCHDVQVASDSGVFAALLRKKNLTRSGQPLPSIPHPTPVAGSLVPFYSREYEISPAPTLYYPPLPRVGSLASIRSDPFRDPLVTTPAN